MMKNKKIKIIVASFVLLSCFSPARAYVHPGGFHTSEQLEYSREKTLAGEQPWSSAYNKLLTKANGALSYISNAPSYYNVPGYYDDPDGHYAARKLLDDASNAAYATALAYALDINLSSSQKNNFGNKAVQVIKNWTYTHKTTGGADGSLTLAYSGNELVRAGELMLNSDLWSSADKAQFVKWANTVVYPKCRGISGETYHNNWADWGMLCSLAVNYAVDDSERMVADIERLKAIIDEQIEPDGSMPRELQRGSSADWYTYFALTSMTGAVEIARNSGTDLYNFEPPSGGTIKSALNFLWNRHSEYSSNPNGYGGELFEAMGQVYNEQNWQNFASGGLVYMSGTGRAWIIPALTRPWEAGYTSNPDTTPPAAPTNVSVQ